MITASGIWEDGKWPQVFLDAQFRRRPRGSSITGP
jgi:hypothetical protein